MASGSQNMTTYKAKQLANTYGSNTKPVYINAGVPTILGTIGGQYNPVWINSGVVTAITAGTTGQFYRGDKTWSNTLVNNFLPGANVTYNLGAISTAWKNTYTQNVYLSYDGVQYGLFTVNRAGTVGDGTNYGTYGRVRLYIGNSIARSTSTTEGENNARGELYIYGTDSSYTTILHGSWSGSDLSVVGTTDSTANATGASWLVLGNSSKKSAEAASSTGYIRIWGDENYRHDIYPGSPTDTRKHYLPNATGWIVTGGNGTSTGAGDSDTPVYLKTDGTLAAITSYDGNAASATKLQTARAINGTNFDGTAAITTANWGTARTLTIGATGKSVNGSSNVSWSTTEILGSSTNAYFYRGDKTWSNDINNTLVCSGNRFLLRGSGDQYIDFYGSKHSGGTYVAKGQIDFGESRLALFVNTNYTSDSTSWVEWMSVRYSDGNVGIGATNPTYKLYVSGSTYTTGTAYFGNTTASFHAKNESRVTNTNGTIGIYSSTDRGLYEYTDSKWIVYLQHSDDTVRFGYNAYVYQATRASYLLDRTNSTASYLNYGASGLAASDITWLCCWNGYEVRAISKAEIFKAVRDNGGDSRWCTLGTTQTISAQKTFTGNLLIGSGGAGGYLNGGASNGGLNSILLGDDVWLGDCNAAGIMGMKSTSSSCGFYFYNSSSTQIGQLYANGSSQIYSNVTLRSDNPDGFRLGYGNYGVIHRNDGSDYYILLTGSGDAGTGSWSSLRPFWIHFADGYVHCGTRLYGAVWNDLAEYRKSTTHEPGYVVIPTESGFARKSSSRLEAGARVISDTYGFCLGDTGDENKSPFAIAGRVLVYPYRNKSEYKIGDAVCTAPGGKVDIMTREEIKEYPDRIVGIVNEIPTYDIWEEKIDTSKSNTISPEPTSIHKVPVYGRIWIDVK